MPKMSKVKELLELAKQCFRHAEICQNRQAADTLRGLGQKYQDEANEIERRQQSVVQAVFPRR
jgi:hypothetical protein